MRLRCFTLIFLSIVLTACGFHLRGMANIPLWLDRVSIISPEINKELNSKLKSQLESYSILVSADPNLAKYWLIISKHLIQQRVVSIGASTNPRQYQLIMHTEFSLQTAKGQIIKAPGTVVVSRQLTINNDRILGSNDEENVLISEMRQESALQIISRLSRE